MPAHPPLSARPVRWWPTLLLGGLASAALLAHGPVAQPAGYHEFAAAQSWLGIARAPDVLSNLGFALVALWGLPAWWRLRRQPAPPGWAGYGLFLLALLATALGSAWYHLAPDDGRLIWDRLPIALACAGLLAAEEAECRRRTGSLPAALALAGFAAASVAWWVGTASAGAGDLRPYLLLQILPFLLVPLWQAEGGVARGERLAFAAALALYALAKVAEVNDHAWHSASGGLSGHTAKHLLATAAAAVLVHRLRRTGAAARRAQAAPPSAAITSGGACTSSISTPSPATGNSSLAFGCRKVMS